MKFSKDKPEEIASILAEGVEMAGELSFTDGLRVDGVLKGKIRSEAFLVIGPKGRVDAEVVIRKISINGEFRGVVRATDRVEVHKEGRVYGEIYTPCLIIEAGALFEGKCNMSEQVQSAKAQKAGPEQPGPSSPPPAASKSAGEDRIKTL
jgi:cytoskeletal protein CcmA (bactofilin family)